MGMLLFVAKDGGDGLHGVFTGTVLNGIRLMKQPTSEANRPSLHQYAPST